jgi:hypothetical protein
LNDFFLASDRGRIKGVHLIEWQEFVNNLVQPVVADEVVAIQSLQLPEGDELSIPMSSAPTGAGDIQPSITLYRELSKANEKAVDQFIPKWRTAFEIPGNEII